MCVLTCEAPADVLHSSGVVVVPVSDDDLLDAGVELAQSLFQAADVFRYRRFPGVYQHPPAEEETIQKITINIFVHKET